MIEIRKASIEDTNDIVSIFEDSVRGTCSKDYQEEQIEAWLSASKESEKFVSRLLAGPCFLLKEAGFAVAFANSEPSNNLIDCLYVRPAFQGKGYGSMLLEALEKELQKPMHVYASITAKPFFEKHGYRVEKENVVTRQGVSLTNYLMVRD